MFAPARRLDGMAAGAPATASATAMEAAKTNMFGKKSLKNSEYGYVYPAQLFKGQMAAQDSQILI